MSNETYLVYEALSAMRNKDMTTLKEFANSLWTIRKVTHSDKHCDYSMLVDLISMFENKFKKWSFWNVTDGCRRYITFDFETRTVTIDSKVHAVDSAEDELEDLKF